MRIEYRTRNFRLDATDPEFGPWVRVKPGKEVSSLLGMQFRIVDDEGNEVPQTEPFVPAYYEFVGMVDTYPGRLHWQLEEPNPTNLWLRRDDVKPTARP